MKDITMTSIFVFMWVLFLTIAEHTTHSYSSEELKCHVCTAVVNELKEAVMKENPEHMISVSGFRMDADGNSVGKLVPLIKSEMYLTELMEDICSKMGEYARATYKKSGKLTLLKMIVDGKMNPESSEVDFVTDGDRNRSLEHYCHEILEYGENDIITAFQAETLHEDIDINICSATCYGKSPIVNDTYDDSEHFRDEL